MDLETFRQSMSLSQKESQFWYPVVLAAMKEYDIDTPARQAAFLAQIGHESLNFRFSTEIWGPTPSQIKYEGRSDLGNSQKGDGFKYRGRGFIQITGRKNYTEAMLALNLDLLEHPDLLSTPENAARSAAWWWKSRDLNQLSDVGDFLKISIRINGKNKDGLPNGWEDRRRRWELAKKVLGVKNG